MINKINSLKELKDNLNKIPNDILEYLKIMEVVNGKSLTLDVPNEEDKDEAYLKYLELEKKYFELKSVNDFLLGLKEVLK